MILIESKQEVDRTLLLNEMGYHNLQRIRAEPLESVLYPPEGQVYIGSYRGLTIVCERELPFHFLTDMVNSREHAVHKLLPDAEICALTLLGSVNLWGYSVARDDRKIRARSGSRETGTILDTGEPLPQETGLLARASRDASGNRVYRLDDRPGRLYFEDEVGEEFVFALSERYFGVRLDEADVTLLDTPLWGYSFDINERLTRIRNKRRREKWAIVFVIIGMLILWHLLRWIIWK